MLDLVYLFIYSSTCSGSHGASLLRPNTFELLSRPQGQSFASPTIIVTDFLGGLEDIPEGVVAVLSLSATDVLSHVAIRARNQVGSGTSVDSQEGFNVVSRHSEDTCPRVC